MNLPQRDVDVEGRRKIERGVADVLDHADDFERPRSLVVVVDQQPPADGPSIQESIGKRRADKRHARRVRPIRLSERPSLQQSRADG
jgi:hypothetical protein